MEWVGLALKNKTQKVPTRLLHRPTRAMWGALFLFACSFIVAPKALISLRYHRPFGSPVELILCGLQPSAME